MKIRIWHNIVWSRYKAAVFSALQILCEEKQQSMHVFQIAETATQRSSLAPIDRSWHKYPYEVLFPGSYEAVPKAALLCKIGARTWIDDADVTILAGYDRAEYWLQALILLFRRKPFACFCDSTINDNQQKFLVGLLKRIFFYFSDGVFCYGQRAAEYVGRYGVPHQKIFHRCQAAALPRDYSPERVSFRRSDLAATIQEPRFLYVGRISPEKSLDRLIRAFVVALKKHPSASLAIVGTGPQENELKQLVLELGIESQIEFKGAKFDQTLFDEYLKATCLVLPSYSEPWGLVVNESLSHGCPAIVSDRCGCVPELIDEGKTGFAFDWENIQSLAEKLILAPDSFNDINQITRNCLDQIAPFSPSAAARSILDGCLKISRKEPSTQEKLSL